MHYRVKSPRIEVSNIIKDLFEATSDSLLGHLGGATHWARVRGVVEYYSIGKLILLGLENTIESGNRTNIPSDEVEAADQHEPLIGMAEGE